MKRDLICSLVLLIIAAGYYFFTSSIGTSALSDEVGAAGLPTVYSIGLAGVALVLGLQALLRWLIIGSQAKTSTESPDFLRMFLRAGGVLAIGIVYLLIVNIVGYVIALLLVLMAMLFYLGEGVGRQTILAAVIGAGFFWVLFDRLLGIPTPGIGSF
ncbi:MAG: tripartite tricarboxylate transporter TctB family protein [Gammaproteobacteria bacterium]|nr:tripartite tricarboxylate transporter TctB family protein [Gammaproteobacteria bacterium]